MEMANIPNEAGFDALVNAPESITLYNRDGKSIQTTTADEAYWLKLGFSRKAQDIASLVSEVQALAIAVDDPWIAYAHACETSGFIDSKAQDVAIFALQSLSEACNNLHLALHTAYRLRGDDEIDAAPETPEEAP